MTLVTVSHAKQYSDIFEKFLREVERLCIQPKKGATLRGMEAAWPDTLAGIIGHALHQQEFLIPRGSPLRKEFEQLKSDVKRYLQNVAYGTTSPYDRYGNCITDSLLWDYANQYQRGDGDRYISETFGVDVGDMRSIFNGDSVEASGIIFEDEKETPVIFKHEETQRIRLLGETPVAIEDHAKAEALFKKGVAAWEEAKAASRQNDHFGALWCRIEAQNYFDQACELGYPDACGYMGQDDIQEYNRSKNKK